ncbi:hypothetical protein UT300007_20560 [Clostridium sp. CTA-7]
MFLRNIRLDDTDFIVYKDGEFNTCGFTCQKKAKMLSFVLAQKYLLTIKNEDITCVICKEELLESVIALRPDVGIIICENPRKLIFKINEIFKNKYFYSKIDKSSRISDKAIISDKNVIIGKNCVIEPNVIIYENTIIKDNVYIGAGSIIGAEGFMVYNDINNDIAKHKGYVVIDSNTKILNNVNIEKAVFFGEVTMIGFNVILDSAVNISHGVNIKKSTMIGANSKICGYTSIGNEVYIGPGSTISNNLEIGNRCTVKIGSVVVENLKNESEVSSFYAIDHKINMYNRMKIMKGKR